MESVLHENMLPQMMLMLGHSDSNSPDASGLLVIDAASAGKNEERSASFIDSRFALSSGAEEKGGALSRSATLTPGMTFESVVAESTAAHHHADVSRKATMSGNLGFAF